MQKGFRNLLFVFMIGWLFNSAAQSPGQRLYIGLSFSPEAIVHNWYSGYKSSMPFKTGIDFKIRLTGRLAISTGIYLDNQKTVFDYSPFYKQKFFTSNLQIPTRLDVKFKRDKRVSPFITGGVMWGFYSHNKYTTTDDSGKTFHGSDTYSNFNMGLLLGFGLDVSVKRLKFQLFPFYEISNITHYQYNTQRVGLTLSAMLGFL